MEKTFRKQNQWDLAIVGGGAAGLAAAVSAAGAGCSVVVLEKQSRVGKKLLAAGNGRCNFSNTRTDVGRYHGNDPEFARFALTKFDCEENIRFFEEIGIPAVEEEEGRIYPLSGQAAAVVDMLRLAAESRGAKLLTDAAVSSIIPQNGGFSVRSEAGRFYAEKVIIACGGKAGSELGGCEDGYKLLAGLGHKITATAPALVKVKTDPRLPRAMKGQRVRGSVRLRRKGETVAESRGELLFTDYGLSGIALMEVSRYLCFHDPSDYTLDLDLLPAFDEEDLNEELKRRRHRLGGLILEHFLTGLIPKKVGMTVLKEALAVKLSGKCGRLSDADLSAAAHLLKNFSLPVTGTLSWRDAQVTAGGADTADFDEKTMMSRLVPGLYAAGEVLDIDGDCGGFNLQWAWSSGRLAASSVLKALEEER